MGHLLSNGSYIWSKSYSFKSSPYPGQDSLQRVIIFGDMGKVTLSIDGMNCVSVLLSKLSFLHIIDSKKIYISSCIFQAERDGSNEYSDYQPGSLNTTDQLIKDLENIDIVFHIGDLSYANGYISQWDQFTSQVEPIASTVPYMVARFVQLFII